MISRIHYHDDTNGHAFLVLDDGAVYAKLPHAGIPKNTVLRLLATLDFLVSQTPLLGAAQLAEELRALIP